MMQAYSAPPFNITYGVTTVQARRGGRHQVEVLAEGLNLTNHVNVVTRNTNFGIGAYPTNPLPTFRQVTAVGEPRSFQFGPG